jgi:hypothetical protein
MRFSCPAFFQLQSSILLLTSFSTIMAAAPGSRPFWRDNELGLAVLSTGTWTTYGTLRGFQYQAFDDGLERYEFNKILSMAFYGKVFGQPAFLALPIHWTAKRLAGEDLNRIAPGDLEMYLGHRLGRAEARLGLILPAGYDRGLAWTGPGEGKAGDPWIGPGHVQLTAGAALNPNLTRYSERWEASGEAKWALALDDGIAKAGSWSLFPSAKVSFRPGPTWKSGVEVSGHWKSQHWGRSVALRRAFGADADWNAGMVATPFLEAFLLPGTAVGAKAGHSLWGYRDASSYNGSVYLLYFP